jgi:hypothetical protein
MDQQSEISKKKFYKQWWFWVIVVLVLYIIGVSGNNSNSVASSNIPTPVQVADTTPAPTSAQTETVPQATTPKTAKTPPVQTPAPTSQPVTPPAPPATWHQVASFSGSGGTNTNTFAIQGSKWRIDWTMAPQSGAESYCQQNGCNLAVLVYKDNGDEADQFLQNSNQTTSGTAYEYAKPGNYYLKVVPGNMTWTMTVEDYY